MFLIGDVLKKVPFFQDLSQDDINDISEMLKYKNFKEEDIVCAVGDPGDRMYILLNGKVKILAGTSSEGKEEILAQLGPGNYFGEMALLTGEPRSATVVAETACETFVLMQSDFNTILDKYPSISLTMSRIMSKRLRETIRKRAKRPKQVSGPAGPRGNLKDRGLTEVIRFCEDNSLTGDLEIIHDDQTAFFNYKKGELTKVKLGLLDDDNALDEILLWEEGEFVVKPKLLTFGDEEKVDEPDKAAGSTIDKKAIVTILVINNSIVIRKLIERNFAPLGYKVITTENIDGIGSSLKTDRPELIISDIKFKEMNGIELCNKLREEQELSEVPFIFLTDSHTDDAFINEAKQLNQIFFSKAHDMAGLLETVKSIF